MSDVTASLGAARDSGAFVSLNLLVFPGVTDDPVERDMLFRVVETFGVDMIQLRNLSIDPEAYTAVVKGGRGAMGIRPLVEQLRRTFPRLRIGYFNPPVKG